MEAKQPFAALICSKPVKEPSNKPALDYSTNSQLNKNWEKQAGQTPTWRKDTDDHDA